MSAISRNYLTQQKNTFMMVFNEGPLKARGKKQINGLKRKET